MYLSFKATNNESKFFINASYSPSLSGDSYDNAERCSDKGANLGNVEDINESGSGSDSGTTPNSNIPTVKVLSKS